MSTCYSGNVGVLYAERRDVASAGIRPDVFTPPSIGRLHAFTSPSGSSMVASPSPPPPQVKYLSSFIF